MEKLPMLVSPPRPFQGLIHIKKNFAFILLRRTFIGALLALALAVQGAETAGASTQPGLEPRGPGVEITPRAGQPYRCVLLGLNAGILELQMPDGEHKRENAQAVRGIQFLPPPPAKTAPEAKSGPRAGEAGDVLTLEELERLHQLRQKEKNGLSEPENEELFNLSERIARVLAARKLVHEEALAGRLENYIAIKQNCLKNAGKEAEAKDIALALLFSYHQKGLPTQDIQTKLRRDMETISQPQIREKVLGALPALLEMLRFKNEKEQPHHRG